MIKRLRARRLGFENNRVSFEAYQFLKEHLPLKAALEPVAGWVEEQRMIKSDDEIDRIRAELEERVGELASELGEGPVPRPPTWGGFRLVPTAWEFWQHRASRLHDRFRCELEPSGGWRIERLFP